MEEKNLIEKLVEISPGMEIWWDSSPVIFSNWCRKMLDKAEAGDRETLQRQFDRMYDPSNPKSQLFRGMIADNPGIDSESLFWKLYLKVVKRGSDMYLPLFEKTGYKEGFLSGQIDPRSLFDKDAMIKQALEIAKINPNVMIKVPGSKEGYDVIRKAFQPTIP
jgi:transaldolase